jgi:hypothetical protein
MNNGQKIHCISQLMPTEGVGGGGGSGSKDKPDTDDQLYLIIPNTS